jgi:hypothetical protein
MEADSNNHSNAYFLLSSGFTQFHSCKLFGVVGTLVVRRS